MNENALKRSKLLVDHIEGMLKTFKSKEYASLLFLYIFYLKTLLSLFFILASRMNLTNALKSYNKRMVKVRRIQLRCCQ